jgi:hypothetical protein
MLMDEVPKVLYRWFLDYKLQIDDGFRVSYTLGDRRIHKVTMTTWPEVRGFLRRYYWGKQ